MGEQSVTLVSVKKIKKKNFANQFLHQSSCYKTPGFTQIEWTCIPYALIL